MAVVTMARSAYGLDVGPEEGREQMYARLSGLPAHLEICWVGPVSS